MQDRCFLVVGSGEKVRSCAERLKSLGFNSVCADSDIEQLVGSATDIILPLPTVRDGLITGTRLPLEQFKKAITADKRVYYGNLADADFPCFAVSYYNGEFIDKNSLLTAMGVIRLLRENIQGDLTLLNAAILGYGSCGSAIGRCFINKGIITTAFCRREETRLTAERDGLGSSDISDLNDLADFDIIVNTVPQNILGDDTLKRLTQKNLYIEIASKPYGFDIGKSERFDFRFILAEGLPGRFFPAESGRNIADEVIKEGKI